MSRGHLNCSVNMWGHCSWLNSNSGSKSGKLLLKQSEFQKYRKEALFVSGKVECNDPTKETTIVYDFLLTVDSLQNNSKK